MKFSGHKAHTQTQPWYLVSDLQSTFEPLQQGQSENTGMEKIMLISNKQQNIKEAGIRDLQSGDTFGSEIAESVPLIICPLSVLSLSFFIS